MTDLSSTDQDHPITPSLELVGQWLCSEDYLSDASTFSSMTITGSRLQNVATQAARWGADRQLEQCVAWLEGYERGGWGAEQMLSCCRPQPSSLKKQALALLEPQGTPARLLNEDQMGVIRRALEQLPND